MGIPAVHAPGPARRRMSPRGGEKNRRANGTFTRGLTSNGTCGPFRKHRGLLVRRSPTGEERRSHRLDAYAEEILALVAETPDITLVETATCLEEPHWFRIAPSTVWRLLDRHGRTFKLKPRSPASSNILMSERLVFIDETGVSTRMAIKRSPGCSGPSLRPILLGTFMIVFALVELSVVSEAVPKWVAPHGMQSRY